MYGRRRSRAVVHASLDVAAARRKSTRTRAHPRRQTHWPHRRRKSAAHAIETHTGRAAAVKPTAPLLAADARLLHPSLDLNLATCLRCVCATAAYIRTNSCAALPTSPAPSPPPPDPSRPPRASSRQRRERDSALMPPASRYLRCASAKTGYIPTDSATPRPIRRRRATPVPRTQRRPRIHGPVCARGSGS
ncbi:hypothetical protein B0H15DRAFT_844084 [Mycena belliarum]|uniref:Uncharacterized protein n=1 Tax=Mycena belliarum TaxID=1033014 RepID=A0AAD6XLG8_9AGAR|nr:hypothetical protein B0H15DRAFT_844084 [Mycena belliae]